MEEYYMLKPQLDEMGNVVYDFYGNVVYIEDTTRKYTRPKSNSNFILNENPYIEGYQPSGFEWASAIDLYYYCFEESVSQDTKKREDKRALKSLILFNPTQGNMSLSLSMKPHPRCKKRNQRIYTPCRQPQHHNKLKL